MQMFCRHSQNRLSWKTYPIPTLQFLHLGLLYGSSSSRQRQRNQQIAIGALRKAPLS